MINIKDLKVGDEIEFISDDAKEAFISEHPRNGEILGLMVGGKFTVERIDLEQIKVCGNSLIQNTKFKYFKKVSTQNKTPKTALDYLSECAEVQKERGESYDTKNGAERSFKATATAFNAITGNNLKGSDICLLLNMLKYVRQYSDPTRLHEDSILDAVSYSSLWGEELNAEEEKKNSKNT